jgi:hypothetical protein
MLPETLERLSVGCRSNNVAGMPIASLSALFRTIELITVEMVVLDNK